MKILITNSRLDTLGGSQSFLRDLGRGLKELGHEVVAHSLDPGDPQRLLELGIMPTVNQLQDLPFRPDLIHAQHHLEAMMVMLGLPGVPAIYHCHGAVWRETPPVHPRIYRYLAMSRTLAERMVVEGNLPPAMVTVILNTVDPAHFKTVRQPSAQPTRALFYNKFHGPDSTTVKAIRLATANTGIPLDFIGEKFNNMISNPEEILPQYDLVFASGRSAIDALACGCAVVVLGRTSCGALVVPENYARLREVNFSIAVNSPPPAADQIEAELRRYTAAGCVEVTERLRADADLGLSIRNLANIYQEVITQHEQTPEDLVAEMRATSHYLRRLTPLVSMTDHVLGFC